ncbi:MAG TPA: RES family NAD+ phosphorylase [Opitutaceae bacterium]|nr:RES family NAD+ phosphorylase [Opitutaceae bacterium]
MRISAWRLVRAELATHAFEGEGARLYGGRWNPPGWSAVYAASNRALAVLEVLAHLPKPLRNAAFALHRVEFDETELETLGADTLPGDWTQFPPAAGTQEAGRRWLERGERAVLAVPSVLLPEERNFVFNPRHPAFAQLRPHRERLFFFDPRLG